MGVPVPEDWCELEGLFTALSSPERSVIKAPLP